MLKSLQFILLVTLLCAVQHNALHAQEILPNGWMPNGSVYAMARQGDIMYVGGEFTQVGRPLAHGVVFDVATGLPRVNDEKLTSTVNHVVSDGQGGFFVNGNFVPAPGQSYKYIQHLLPNGELSTSFNPVIPGNSQIKVLAATADRVLIKTRFGSPHVHALYCVGYDGTIFWSRTANGRILDGIESNGVIIVVGNFTFFEGQSRTRAAALNILTGELLPWNTGNLLPAFSDNPSSTNATKTVVLGISGNELFIRWRSQANIDPNTMVASVSLETGTATGWTLPAHSSGTSVPPMLVHNGKVYMATNSGQGLLIVDAATKQTLPNPTGISVLSPDIIVNRIKSIAAVNNTIYLGGGNMVDQNGVPLSDVVAFNETTLEKENFSTDLFQNYVYPGGDAGSPISTIYCMSGDANGLFIGGYFPSIMAVPRTNLYAYNIVTGELLPFAPVFTTGESVITHLFASDSRLYTSGLFHEVNGQERLSGLASFNLADGSLNDWNPVVDNPGISPTLLVYGFGDRVYVYGALTTVDGVSRNGVAAFEAPTGLLINEWAPEGLSNAVAMTANESGVFVAGSNTDYTANQVQFYDHQTANELFPAITYSGGDGANAIRTMAANENDLFVGGDFTIISTDAEQFSRPNFAAVDLTNGLVNDFSIETSSVALGLSGISSIVATNGSVYLGGYFSDINGVPRHTVAAISATSGELTDWKFRGIRVFTTPLLERSVNTMLAYDDGVFIGGAFDRINDRFYIHNLLQVSPDRSNVVTGTVFYDNNGNGIRDAGENGVPNLLMELQPGNIFYPTDANGDFIVYTGLGNYTVRPVHPTYAISVSPEQSNLAFTDQLQVSESNDFAIAIFPEITDMGVTLTTDQDPRPGFYFNYVVTYTNHGTIASNGTVEVTYDARLLYQHSSVPVGSEVNNVLTYNFINVAPGESRVILINMRVPVPTIEGSLMGAELQTQATVATEVTDSNLDNNILTLIQTVIGSVDPNDKLVTPQGYGPNGYIAEDTDHLEYTIRFQNVGTAAATFVTLEDVLDPNLDISTFSVISASHAYSYEIVDRTLNVLFDNINLPDSIANEPDSHGYFTFNIGLNADLPAGTQIQNSAAIVFDYNLPLETNVVTNTLRNAPYETTIFLPDSTGVRNSQILIPVFVNDWEELLGVQFSVAWDNSVATFVGVESFALPGIDLNAFNLSTANEGYFSFAWSDPTITPQTLPDTSALFYIRFTLTGNPGAETAVAITNHPVAIEAIAADYQSIEVVRVDGMLRISTEVTIQGTVQYSNDQSVQNVVVELRGSSITESATNAEGQYEFTFEPTADEESVIVTPSKQNDPGLLNGIDVQDAASMRRHILRTELLTTPYQVIASDVSNNNNVSIQDVILLQALILDVESDLPDGRQWTFVDAEHDFTIPLSPFPYPQSVEVELSELMLEDRFNFTAVKMGDVTMDRDNTQTGRTKGQEVVLEISAPSKMEDGTYEVSVSTLGFVDVSAYQFTINWDHTKLDFLNVIDENVQGVYGQHGLNDGYLTTVWDEVNGASLTLDDNSKLFKLRFNPLDADPGQILITDQATAMKMFDNKLDRIEFSVRQGTAENKASGNFYPNPFEDIINISFTLQESQLVKIEIMNDLGQKVGEVEDFYNKGWNEVKIDGSSFRKGLYLFSINIGGKKEVSKLIKK